MNRLSQIAMVAVTRRGVEQARLLRRRLRAGEILRPQRYGPALHSWETPFDAPLAELVPPLFEAKKQIIFFLAAGAVTRLIAPCLGSKATDPAVLAVDEAGQFVIPLLSGHLGGANESARIVAGCLGATAVITTASDVIGGWSLDLLAEKNGWVAEPKERLKTAARVLVDGQPIALVQELNEPGSSLDHLDLPANVTLLRDAAEVVQTPFAYVLWITDRHAENRHNTLFFRPKSLVVGVGCERGVPVAALEDGLEQYLGKSGFARDSIAALASVELKADEPGLLELAERNHWPTVFFSAEELAAVRDMPNPSQVVERCVGTPGVAEPAALLASGARRLLVEKQILQSAAAPQRMTFALARLASFEPTGQSGPASKVIFVGAGPGDPDLLTLKGRRVLADADVVVYAGSLIPQEILRQARPTAILHNSAHLTLDEVMAILTEASRSGKRVLRLHSGDTSIYSAIQEQMTMLDAAGIGYEVIPGISSYQAAAAALATELTLPETTQTVILTRGDGETPMPAAEDLESLARHRATLCIFLSARLAEKVQEQLLRAYPPQTPTVIAYRVSWPDEKIIVTQLQHLADEIRQNSLRRTTLIMVGEALGNRRNRSRLYDPNHAHLFRAKSREQTHSPA